jgi:hypothetical protein
MRAELAGLPFVRRGKPALPRALDCFEAGGSCQKGTERASQEPATSDSGWALRSSARSRLPWVESTALRRRSMPWAQANLVHVGVAGLFCGARFLFSVLGMPGTASPRPRRARCSKPKVEGLDCVVSWTRAGTEIQWASLHCAARRAKAARRKKPGRCGRDESWSAATGAAPRLVWPEMGAATRESAQLAARKARRV